MTVPDCSSCSRACASSKSSSAKRWADARHLLNDDTLPTTDRVAGLLLILYAQKIATISQLTADDVDITGETVARKASGGDWAAYATAVSQRANRPHQQGENVHVSG